MHTPLPTPREMNRWDAAAVKEFGIRSEILMENASREALHVLLKKFGEVGNKKALLIAGPGNNGGDAFALARHLLARGAETLVLHTKPKRAYKGAAGYHLGLAAKVGVPLAYLKSSIFLHKIIANLMPAPDIIVDGLLGTGFSGELREDSLAIVREINTLAQNAFVLALDIPSGLEGLEGRPKPEAVRADATATFAAPKIGLLSVEAREFTGSLNVCEIGIPRQIFRKYPPTHYLLNARILDVIPDSVPSAHKGTFGHVLIIGGSPGLTGAPMLAALGALRGGAGLATIACPAGLATEIKASVPDVMLLPLSKEREWSAEVMDELAPHLERFDAVALGPGIGRKSGVSEFIQAYIHKKHPKTLFDADALYFLKDYGKETIGLPQIITPHPGEAARLLHIKTVDVQANRTHICRLLSERFGAVVALKGAETLICDPEGAMYVSPFAEPNLAIGGSGDVLSGLISCILAQSAPPLEATLAGVYWHGHAGKALSKKFPHRGNLAQEIAHQLPKTLKELKYADR